MTESALKAKINPAVLLWTGVPLLVAGFWSFSVYGNQSSLTGSSYPLILSVVGILIGLLFSGFGLAGYFLEPPQYSFDISSLSQEHPIRIPDLNAKGSNFLIIWAALIATLSIYLYLHLKTNGLFAPVLLDGIVVLMLGMVFFGRARRYIVFPDRIELSGMFIKNETIYFKDIQAIQKSRLSTFPKPTTYKVVGFNPLLSVKNEVVGIATKDTLGASVEITTNDNQYYFLPNCQNPDETVRQLKTLLPPYGPTV